MTGKKSAGRAPDGSSIFRHSEDELKRTYDAPAETEGVEEIEAHIAKYFGEASNVFHELVSDKVHIDVHFIAPTPERNRWTLFTTGMSALPMSVPEGAEDYAYAELMISLPAGWNVNALAQQPPPKDLERWYWPIRWLKQLARLPHDYNTWLGSLHTIPNGDPPRPFSPETKLCGWVLLPPFEAEDGAQSVSLSDGREVHIYCLHALHANEMDLKLQKGGEVLLQALANVGLTEELDLARPSVVGKKQKRS